jgi:hypothetical protein
MFGEWKPYTEKHTQKLVHEEQSVSNTVTTTSGLNDDKIPVNKGESHIPSLLGIPCLKESEMAERGGFEPQITAFLFRVTDCDSRSQAMTFINVFNGFSYLDGLQTDDGR